MRPRVAVKNLTRFLFAGIFSVCLASSSFAQRNPTGPPPGAGPPANNNPNLEDRSRRIDESRLRSAEMEVGAAEANQERVQAAIQNMKADFVRIQILRNDIARNLAAHKPLSYALISEQTAELTKRATRLSVYMRARVREEKEQKPSVEFKGDEMVGALVKLCKLIDSFTENPTLKNAATVDLKEIDKASEYRANADRDLLAIINLSGNIQKKSENLRTPHQ